MELNGKDCNQIYREVNKALNNLFNEPIGEDMAYCRMEVKACNLVENAKMIIIYVKINNTTTLPFCKTYEGEFLLEDIFKRKMKDFKDKNSAVKQVAEEIVRKSVDSFYCC